MSITDAVSFFEMLDGCDSRSEAKCWSECIVSMVVFVVCFEWIVAIECKSCSRCCEEWVVIFDNACRVIEVDVGGLEAVGLLYCVVYCFESVYLCRVV